MKPLIFLMIISFFITGCSVKYPVVGKFDKYNEVFKGSVESNLLNGTSYIEVEGQVSKKICRGASTVTYIPPIAYIVPTCKGQKGKANLMCDDGTIVDVNWEAKSCTSGFGSGFDQNGNKFSFVFGMNDTEALEYVNKELKMAANKPDLPTYKPKEVRKEKGFSTGTGFFVSDNGYIITNYHVVQDAKEIIVITSKGQQLSGKYVNGDLGNDVALIKTDIKSHPLIVLEKNNIDKGEEVLTLGYPLIQIQGQEQKASFGRINSLTGIKGNPRFLQIDIPVQPGNSGGPLLNNKGQVVGVVTATLDEFVTLQISGKLPQNVNYAIKSDFIFPIMRNILGDKLEKDNENTKKDMKEIVKLKEQSVVLIIAK